MASFFDLFRRRGQTTAPVKQTNNKQIVGASDQFDVTTLTSFDNSNITYSSKLASLDYDRILRDKQGNIKTLYELSDYYCDSDPICNAIIKQVYFPYSTSSGWFLTCNNKKTIDIYEKYYKEIHLRQKIEDIMLNYFKYANVYVYIWDGNLMVLPPHKCQIGNVSLNGTPTVFFDVQSIISELKIKSFSYLRSNDIDDDDRKNIYKGYPPEIAKAIISGNQYAQLNTDNLFVLQGPKEGWMRYSIPWIASALQALARKELISNWQNAMLNLSQRGFVHVTYGDTQNDILPDIGQLQQVRAIFSSAMSGNPLAVTNQLAHAEMIVTDISGLYQWPLYKRVNSDIMGAGGISAILANGQSEDGSTFASAQVSIQTVTTRIEAARRQVEDFMNKVNERLVEDIAQVKKYNIKEIPGFHFKPFSFSGKKELSEVCKSLWDEGLVSTNTLMETYGYNLAKQKAQRETEIKNGIDELMKPREYAVQSDISVQDADGNPNPVGRPTMTNDERTSDPQNAIRSKQAQDAAGGDIVQESNTT